ncbi:HD-like signal output (HDOD) domain, no enzymatic activity [Marinobacter segnicrescens]|uniref:HD-like signal output (HDOD) domain, no enzymatic activity n=1 Tax=Marinobacter segnicrescens TaxID=430453 RepID=A0A1I0G2J3_9GAMM|nr:MULTISPECIES: HDOD domain-containing protein [Marinobacter]UZD66854.1 HDOD domain-containing protein [Marinobacter sp. AN1]SET64103.1 HD-like signal output (HDOD) domain, no enzymatic activity [Marinobacter segnicrescens]
MTVRENLALSRLREFRPLDRLTDEQLVVLVSRAERRVHRPGQKIVERGARDGMDFFLLKGAVELVAADGRQTTVSADTDKANTAIARLQPRMFDVTAIQPCEFLVIEQAVLNKLLQAAPLEHSDGGSASDGDADEEHRLLMEFYAELRSNQVSLPSLPDVAWKVRRLADREDSSADDIARALTADPAMSAKLVRSCNSALYRGFSEVRNVRDGVVRLGVRTTRQLVTVFALREVFRSRQPELQKAMDRLWQEARSVGALAYVLAESATRLEPEEALLAGLLHNIGAIPVLVHAEHHPALVASPAALERALAELQSDIGAAILDHWHFPAAFVEAARHGDDWFYECPEERPQLVDLVIVSRLHARISEGRNDGLPEFEQVPAYRRLGALELTASRSLKLLEAARERLDELQRLLAGQ